MFPLCTGQYPATFFVLRKIWEDLGQLGDQHSLDSIFIPLDSKNLNFEIDRPYDMVHIKLFKIYRNEVWIQWMLQTGFIPLKLFWEQKVLPDTVHRGNMYDYVSKRNLHDPFFVDILGALLRLYWSMFVKRAQESTISKSQRFLGE